jgi:DNA recombination protein RmuC
MSPLEYIIIAVVTGAGIAVILWVLRRAASGRPVPSEQSREVSPLEEELRRQLEAAEREVSELRERWSLATTQLASANATVLANEKLLAEQRALHERSLADARTAQDKAIADLREAFKALSADALKQTAPEFLRLANETFAKFQEGAKGDLALRQQAIATLVKPLEEQLKNYQQRLQQNESSQADTLGKVKEQLAALAASSQSLATETAEFRSVLKSNQARGRWGEETLRRVVEAAGLSAHCDFTEQSRGDEGKPDMIVRLPGERMIIVDSKVPDLDVVSTADSAAPAKRAELLAAHAAKLRATIKALADREYPKQFPNALDHVVLFLPAESLFSTALEGDPELIVWAESKRVYLATPASFIAVLRTINFIWQQHAQSENAQKIAEAAREFYVRVVKFTEHFERIRAGLDRANAAFNDATASFQLRVRPAGERLAELGGGAPGKELTALQPLDSPPRQPSAG